MSEATYTHITDDYAVSGQINIADLAAFKAAGFRSIMINRPDGEGGPDQPTSAEVISLAEELGLTAVYLPIISGGPTEANVEEFSIAIEELPKPVLTYCRSGNRSATVCTLAAQNS